MQYIGPDGTFPLHYGDIMIAHPGWEKGDPLPEGWVYVESAPAPEFGESQVIERGQPQEINGVMTETWVVRDMTQEELDVKNAPIIAKQKLVEAGLSDAEIFALVNSLR